MDYVDLLEGVNVHAIDGAFVVRVVVVVLKDPFPLVVPIDEVQVVAALRVEVDRLVFLEE